MAKKSLFAATLMAVLAGGSASAQQPSYQVIIDICEAEIGKFSRDACDSIIESNATSPEVRGRAYFQRAVPAYYSSQDDAALDDLNSAIRYHPELVDAYRLRSLIYTRKDRIAESIRDLSRIIDLEKRVGLSSLPSDFAARGRLREKIGDIQGAIQDYQSASAADPEGASSWIGELLQAAQKKAASAK